MLGTNKGMKKLIIVVDDKTSAYRRLQCRIRNSLKTPTY